MHRRSWHRSELTRAKTLFASSLQETRPAVAETDQRTLSVFVRQKRRLVCLLSAACLCCCSQQLLSRRRWKTEKIPNIYTCTCKRDVVCKLSHILQSIARTHAFGTNMDASSASHVRPHGPGTTHLCSLRQRQQIREKTETWPGKRLSHKSPEGERYICASAAPQNRCRKRQSVNP